MTQPIIKQIHATLRAAGYTRQASRIVVGPTIYRSITRPGEIHIIYIPGNWSIPLRDSFRRDLLERLKEFSPELYPGEAGVYIKKAGTE